MGRLNRRTFVQLSSGAALTAAAGKVFGNTSRPSITSNDRSIEVRGQNFVWKYAQADDRFTLLDAKNRQIVTGTVQPSIVVAPIDQPAARICSPGKLSRSRVEADRVTFTYEGVNGDGHLSCSWRFDDHGMWTEPVVFEPRAALDVISLHYFTDPHEDAAPALRATYLVVPGALSGATISPILQENVHLNESVWLGRGSFIPGLSQQWGLPVHYFCGFSAVSPGPIRNLLTQGRSDAFTCGLADLPAGDLFLKMYEGSASLWIDYRSDLWKHLRGPGPLNLGATLFWSIAPDYYEAIAAYYEGLVQAGIIHRKENSAKKTAMLLTPQFCTWGAQLDRDKTEDKLDETALREIYQDFRSSSMKAGLFSIDDKWEGTYGRLEHSETRFPHFEQFLAQLRTDGMRLGLWAAIMRCERPADLGLTEDNVLKLADGKPYLAHFNHLQYYILDFTQPRVAAVLTEIVRKFIRRYQPDVVKFDFGYELPSVAIAAPQDKQWTGERLMWKGLDVVIKAMRAENPDQVVMYYNLSPLFLDYFDLHSPDDLYMDLGEYDIEANRRFFFSSLMGRLGVPTYGSSGYDWASAPAIWFDSAALGTLGSLNDFRGDEEGETGTPAQIAKYNGITQVLRTTSLFEIVPIGNVSQAPVRGAHARSWARFENGQLVLLAYRPPMPGQQDILADRLTDARVKHAIEDAVVAQVPVIVSSQGDDGLARSGKLGIVAYGAGDIAIMRQQGSKAHITHHYFGGATSHSSIAIEQGYLKVSPVLANAAGSPLEWIEIQIA